MHFVQGRGAQRALRMGVIEAEDAVVAGGQLIFEAEDVERVDREPTGWGAAQVGGGDQAGRRPPRWADQKTAGFGWPRLGGRIDQLATEESPVLAVGTRWGSPTRGR